MKNTRFFLILLSLATLFAGAATAQDRDRDRDDDRRDRGRHGRHYDRNWTHLGSQAAGRGLDRDEIRVGGDEGRFRAVKLEVRESTVTIERMVVHFADGSEQIVNVRRRIPAGGETRVIDLKGNGDRVITKVVFWYKTPRMRRHGGDEAVVHLFGRH